MLNDSYRGDWNITLHSDIQSLSLMKTVAESALRATLSSRSLPIRVT